MFWEKGKGSVLTMHVSISHSGVTDPLVNRMTLGLIVKLKKSADTLLCQGIIKTMLHRSCVLSPWYTFPQK